MYTCSLLQYIIQILNVRFYNVAGIDPSHWSQIHTPQPSLWSACYEQTLTMHNFTTQSKPELRVRAHEHAHNIVQLLGRQLSPDTALGLVSLAGIRSQLCHSWPSLARAGDTQPRHEVDTPQ